HQPHDRGAGDRVSVLFDGQFARLRGGEGDELGAGAGVKATAIADEHGAAHPAQAAASPSTSDATVIYLRPASRAAATASVTLIVLRAPPSRISIGRLIPAITSTRPASSSEMARLDGVPPNR